MRMGDTYGGGWFRGEASVVDKPVLTIREVREHKFDDGTPQIVVSFVEDDRELGINKTNAEIIAHMAAPNKMFDMVEDVDIIGTRIQLYWEPSVVYGGKRVGGIRVRPPVGGAAPDPSAPPTGGPPSTPPPGAPPFTPPTPPALPTPDVSDVSDKNTAWSAFSRLYNVDKWRGKILNEAWFDAINGVALETSVPEEEFTTQEWKHVAASGMTGSPIPF